MQALSENLCFGGTLKVIEHDSEALGCKMKFSIFLPPKVTPNESASLIFLSGLTCNHENFTTKAGAYKQASEEGLIIIAPDTSPRGDDIPDDDNYDFGQGAGFYVNATQAPWADNFQMETYIAEELTSMLINKLGVNSNKIGITGHSMGGHGALTLYLKHPALYKSASAFSPIMAPSQVPWGQKAFKGYLGEDEQEWLNHDACALMIKANNRSASPEILIDQGNSDQFLEEQLKPELFEEACKNAGQKLNLRLHDGYDHSYYFIQSFISDHITHHARILNKV